MRPLFIVAALAALPAHALAKAPSAEIGFDLNFNSTSTKATDANGNASNTNGSDLGIDGYYLFIIKSIQVGPELSYDSSTKGDLKQSSLDFGGLGRYTFGKIKIHGVLPYALAGLDLGQNSTTAPDGSSINLSENVIKVGGGMLYFLSPNSAVDANLSYRIINDSGSGTKSTTSGFYLAAGLGVFI